MIVMTAETALIAASAVAFVVGSVAALCLIAYVPQAWRCRRWAYEFGDEDERRAGYGIWVGHVGKLAGVAASDITVVRWLVTDAPPTHPWVMLATAVAMIVLAVCILVSHVR